VISNFPIMEQTSPLDIDSLCGLDYTEFYSQMQAAGLAAWVEQLPAQIERSLTPDRHGDLPQWLAVLAQLPKIQASQVDLNADSVLAGALEDCDRPTRAHIEALLHQLQPWRKGPYTLHGIHIDTEWRSDWKWKRLCHQITPLTGRIVLDVGCGNGYHCWRMVGAGAKLVIGIDPMPLRVVQFFAVRHFMGDWPVSVLPVGIETVPPSLQRFDTVFSMGVLYHRRSPFDHLLELRGALRSGGELVLETLVIEGENGQVLVPENRYARMRNVWFIPSCLTLEAWLKRCGYREIRSIDVTPTTPDEQRRTDWMQFESLAEQLHPDQPSLTVEGLPAPRRAIFLAIAP
jgi:tRNA (mo5U34)-methyltransferase